MADFDPGPELYGGYTYRTCDCNAYISILDNNGNFESARLFGANGACAWNESVNDFVLLDQGSILTTGTFYHHCDFDPSDNKYVKQSKGESDLFLLKLKPCLNTIDPDTIDTTACFEMWAPSYLKYYPMSGVNYVNRWRKSGVYTDYTTNNQGCDYVNYYNATVVESVDTSVSRTDTSLTANANNATYLWMGCDNYISPILPGVKDKTFYPFMDGSYKVEVVQHGCTLQSKCYNVILPNSSVGISAGTNKSEIKIYPVPNDGAFWIDFENVEETLDVRLYDTVGKLKFQKYYQNTNLIHINSELSDGLYQLLIVSSSGLEHRTKILIN